MRGGDPVLAGGGWRDILGHEAETCSPDWRTLPLRPGALFIVGDPKQSIYRFRRADIDIYNIVRRRFSDPAVGRVLPLTVQIIRSLPQLCTWARTRSSKRGFQLSRQCTLLILKQRLIRIGVTSTPAAFRLLRTPVSATFSKNRTPRRLPLIFARKSTPDAAGSETSSFSPGRSGAESPTMRTH